MPAWSLDASFHNHLVVVALCPCWMKAWSLDDFFLTTLVVVALCSCWMPARSMDVFFLIPLVVVALCSFWKPAWSLDRFFLKFVLNRFAVGFSHCLSVDLFSMRSCHVRNIDPFMSISPAFHERHSLFSFFVLQEP